LKIRCQVIVTQQRSRVEQSAPSSQPASAVEGADMSELKARHYMIPEREPGS